MDGSSKCYAVRESGIHGLGLFATRLIAAGEVVGELVGHATDDSEGPHVLWLGEGERAFQVTCDLRYINHHRDPNVCYYDDLTVVALRDILSGEELTHDYGADWHEAHPDAPETGEPPEQKATAPLATS